MNVLQCNIGPSDRYIFRQSIEEGRSPREVPRPATRGEAPPSAPGAGSLGTQKLGGDLRRTGCDEAQIERGALSGWCRQTATFAV